MRTSYSRTPPRTSFPFVVISQCLLRSPMHRRGFGKREVEKRSLQARVRWLTALLAKQTNFRVRWFTADAVRPLLYLFGPFANLKKDNSKKRGNLSGRHQRTRKLVWSARRAVSQRTRRAVSQRTRKLVTEESSKPAHAEIGLVGTAGFLLFPLVRKHKLSSS